MASDAFNDVQLLYIEVDKLIALAWGPSPIQQTACSRSAIVLTHAHLERYLEFCVREYLEALEENAPAGAKWPAPLHETMLVYQLRSPAIQLTRDEAHAQLRTRARMLADKVHRTDRVARKAPLAVSAFLQGDKYPTIRHISRILERCGMPNAIRALEQAHNRPYGRALSNLNRWRGDIAHGDSAAPHLTDVEFTIEIVREFIEALDGHCARHAQGITGLAPW